MEGARGSGLTLWQPRSCVRSLWTSLGVCRLVCMQGSQVVRGNEAVVVHVQGEDCSTRKDLGCVLGVVQTH